MSVPSANPPRPEAWRLPWYGVALFACALLALAGGVTHQHLLSLVAALLLLIAWLPRTLRRRSAVALGGWLAVATLLLVPAAMGHAGLALQALPVAFLSIAAWIFTRTLLPGREPLVSRFVRVIEGDAQLGLPGVRGYTRSVTVFWAALLAGMASLALLIALFAVPGGWLAALGIALPLRVPGEWLVWYPEAGCWTLLATAFAGEYLFRRWYLRGIPQSGARHFSSQLIRHWQMLIDGRDERV